VWTIFVRTRMNWTTGRHRLHPAAYEGD